MADIAERVATLESELRLSRQDHERQIADLLKQLDAQGKRTDAVNATMQAMLSRFEVCGGYPGGADAMMRDFRACFMTS
jgi:hypothetical protein